MKRTFRLLLATFLLAALPHPAARAAEPPLNARVNALINAAGLKNSRVGVTAVEVESGRLLCSIDDQETMTPASNVKLFTTGAALLLLGEDFEFTTAVYAPSGAVEDGVLDGDLVLMAGGDPALSGREHKGKVTAVFDALATDVAGSVRVVRGDVVIDDTIFDREYLHPDWPKNQLIHWYCAPVSALALNDNCVNVYVKPGPAPGQPAQVTLDPPTAYFTIVNNCQTVASGKSRAYITRLPGVETLVITGRLTPKSAGASSPVTVVDPTRFAATVFRERLARAGVVVEGEIVLAAERTDTTGMEQLAVASHSLSSAIRTANKRSQNFYAEMIFKTLGRSVQVPASFADGAEAVGKFLDHVGLRREAYTLVDGSGLSNRNAFSPLQIAGFLRYMARTTSAETYLSSLSVAGVDGTLRKRMKGPATAGKVRAKTGHVNGVSVLSGYADANGRLVAFSILVNGRGLNAGAARRLQDAICRLLVEVEP